MKITIFFIVFVVALVPLQVLRAAPVIIDGDQVRQEFASSTAGSVTPPTIDIPVIPETESDVAEFAKFLTIADTDIVSISLDSTIQLTHREVAKLFGLFTIPYTLTLSTSQPDLRLQLTTPWWLWLSTNSTSSIRTSSQQALDRVRSSMSSSTTEREALLQRQKVLLALLMPWKAQFK